MIGPLKPCPWCGAQPTYTAYDRLIVIGCEPCGYSRAWKGILQTTPNEHPVNEREFYHQHANQHATEGWNTRVVDSECV